jgi:hypothetical protein
MTTQQFLNDHGIEYEVFPVEEKYSFRIKHPISSASGSQRKNYQAGGKGEPNAYSTKESAERQAILQAVKFLPSK